LQFDASLGKKFVRPPSQPIAGHSGVHLSSQAKQKAKIRRPTVPGWPSQKSLQNSLSTEKKMVMLVHACHPSDSRKLKIEGSKSRPTWANETLSPK
jgi:hypothetical protein